jgi:signal peptidase I
MDGSGLSPDPPPTLDSHTVPPSAASQAPRPLETTPAFGTPRIVGPDPILTEAAPAAAPVAPPAAPLREPAAPVLLEPAIADADRASEPPAPDPLLAGEAATAPHPAPITDGTPVPDTFETEMARPPRLPADLPTPEIATLPPPDARRWSISFARVGEELLAWFKTLLSAAVYATLIVTFGFQVARVEGQSMVPTLEDQDRLIVNKLAYRLGDPRVGDIVMLYYPEDPSKSFVKRIVAEPGDTIKIVDGRVLRNDVPLADDFIPEKYRDHDNLGPFVLPRGYYYVMGDHRNNSSDSRTWGYVPKRYIIGKVQLRWWPVNSAKVV